MCFSVQSAPWHANDALLLKDIRVNPQRVLDSLAQAPSEQSPKSKAIRFYIESRAYSALILHEKARQSALGGLALVSDTNTPLYHYLTLAYAEAMDGVGNAEDALKQAQISLTWALQHGDDDLMDYGLSVNGYLNITLNNFAEALRYFQQGYQRHHNAESMFQQSDFAAMLALVYEYRQEPAHAISYYTEAEKYYRDNDVTLELANTLFGLGKNYILLDEINDGLSLFLESADLALEIQDLQGAAYSYEAIASVLINKAMFEKAGSFLDDALALFTQAENPFMQIKVLGEKATIALAMNSPNKGLDFLAQADALIDGDSFLSQRIAINDIRAQAFVMLNDYQSAYEALAQNRKNRLRWHKEVNSKRLLELQTRFELQQQQTKNALLEEQNLRQQNQINNQQKIKHFTILLIALLLLVTALLFWLFINTKRHQKRLEQLANSDNLTGLLTRRKAMEDAEQQFQLAIRHKTPLASAIIDLDHFKQINDNFGHQTGDKVLQLFGALAQKHFRQTDILGRIGGEEFLFMFPNTSVKEAKEMLHRFSSLLTTMGDTLNNQELNITISVGLVAAEYCDDITQVIAQADGALYHTKRNGRNFIKVAQLSA
ncbi:GGDEF domain-containing protein [Alteromonas sp. C1M14]|uniref:GGDEF domain-containing protein n=1 Tax=Alteromonas sp. C1M14 TaxID=2841567 RepID=UPI001C08CBF2|nr:GGDEF domain-containing protein [Alteromonas sp. C1M14]MBU2979688.1 GGDEF domain-containing protein [Alteromonas sp. C1M14]